MARVADGASAVTLTRHGILYQHRFAPPFMHVSSSLLTPTPRGRPCPTCHWPQALNYVALVGGMWLLLRLVRHDRPGR